MDDDNSSHDSGRIQIAHQMTDVKSFTDGSFIPDKAGKLVAALDSQLACQTLKRLVMGKEFCTQTAHGLYIHRALVIIHIEVAIDENPMRVFATTILEGILCPGFLCACMQYFLEKLKKHQTNSSFCK